MFIKHKVGFNYSGISFIFFYFLLITLFFNFMINSAYGALSSSRGSSSFSEKLNRKFKASVVTPKGCQLFRWDFSKKEKLDYKYSKESIITESENVPIKDANRAKTITQSDGIMVINSQGDNKAELVLKNDKTIIKEQNSKGGAKGEPLKVTAPSLIIKSIEEDGSVNNEISSYELFLNLLFLLPSKSLSVGEQAKVNRSYHVKEAGTIFVVDNKTNTTLLRYVEFNGYICAELKSEIFMKKEKVKPVKEVENSYTSTINGKSIFLFDIKRRLVVYGNAAVIVNLHIDKNLDVKIASSQKGKMRTFVTNDSLISFSFIERGNRVTY